ncbi:MAG: hypothetical protein ACRDKX_05805 [Solirubrobacterales bacterium]
MPSGGKRDPRALVAVAGAALLGLGVAAVVLFGGGSDRPAAPQDCIRAWNANPSAVAYGIHNFGAHSYTDARVGRLDASAQAAGEEGFCAVTFPSLSLDREPVAAGQLLQRGTWSPISNLDGVELTRVAELQAEAAGAPNAVLAPDGRLSAQ